MNIYGTRGRKKGGLGRGNSNRSANRGPNVTQVMSHEQVTPGMVYNRVDWTDHNLLDRCTIVLWLYSGMHPRHVKSIIEKVGTSVVVEFAYHPVVYNSTMYRKAIKPFHPYSESDTKMTYF